MGNPERWVAGVDGCRAGWVVVCLALHAASTSMQRLSLCPAFDDILALIPRPEVIAIDMPIGLLDAPQPGGRLCDREARRLLGRRASSVFTPPCRPWLTATTYAHVRHLGLSRQAFGILPKIREVDACMTPALQHQVYEAHPELAFGALAGHPMAHNKKTREGHNERLQRLSILAEPHISNLVHTFPTMLKAFKRAHVAADDLLDACVLACVASRLAYGRAQRVPAVPPVDAHGLRMEICF
jgi:predicted RNase H-like nuclease